MKSIIHLDETSTHFDLFNIKQANEVKGFDPNQLFMTHMTLVGCIMAFSKTILFGEGEDDNRNIQGLSVEKGQVDIETVVCTNNHHKQQGWVTNERSSRSSNFSQKSGSIKEKSQNPIQEQNKSSIDNFDDGGDQNPPKGNLDKSHTLPIVSKRKRDTNKKGEDEAVLENEIGP